MTTKTTGKVTEPSKISRADRPTSFDLNDFPMPAGREEEWRFTPMRRVRTLLDDAPARGEIDVQVQAPQGVSVDNVSKDDPRVGAVLAPGDRPAALAWDKTKTATVITVGSDVELDSPVMVHVTAPETPSAGHIVVRGERHSKATVVIVHDGPAMLNQTVEVRGDEGATLHVVSIHNWDREALHTASARVVTRT